MGNTFSSSTKNKKIKKVSPSSRSIEDRLLEEDSKGTTYSSINEIGAPSDSASISLIEKSSDHTEIPSREHQSSWVDWSINLFSGASQLAVITAGACLGVFLGYELDDLLNEDPTTWSTIDGLIISATPFLVTAAALQIERIVFPRISRLIIHLCRIEDNSESEDPVLHGENPCFNNDNLDKIADSISRLIGSSTGFISGDLLGNYVADALYFSGYTPYSNFFLMALSIASGPLSLNLGSYLAEIGYMRLRHKIFKPDIAPSRSLLFSTTRLVGSSIGTATGFTIGYFIAFYTLLSSPPPGIPILRAEAIFLELSNQLAIEIYKLYHPRSPQRSTASKALLPVNNNSSRHNGYLSLPLDENSSSSLDNGSSSSSSQNLIPVQGSSQQNSSALISIEEQISELKKIINDLQIGAKLSKMSPSELENSPQLGPQATLFAEELHKNLYSRLAAYLTIASGMVLAQPTSTFRGLEFFISLFEPIAEALRTLVDVTIVDADSTVQQAKARRFDIASDHVELKSTIERFSVKIAEAYENILNNMKDTGINLTVAYAVRRILAYLWETGTNLINNKNLNNSELSPSQFRQETFFQNAGRALLIGEPEIKVSGLKNKALNLLEKLDILLLVGRPIKFIEKIHEFWQTKKSRCVKINNEFDIPLHAIFKIGIETEKGEVLQASFFTQNQKLHQKLKDLNCAIRPALFACDSFDVLGDHGWTRLGTNNLPLPNDLPSQQIGESSTSQLLASLNSNGQKNNSFELPKSLSSSSSSYENLELLEEDELNQEERKADKNVSQTVSNPLNGLQFQKIPGDGHCLFHAVGLYLGKDESTLRQIVSKHMEDNFEQFQDFYEGSEEEFKKHIQTIAQGREWGANIEIEVTQRVTNRPIIIIQPEHPPIIPDNIDGYQSDPIFIYFNQDHYDAFVLKEEANPRLILQEIRKQLTQNLPVNYQLTPSGEPSVDSEDEQAIRRLQQRR